MYSVNQFWSNDPISVNSGEKKFDPKVFGENKAAIFAGLLLNGNQSKERKEEKI